MKIRTSFLIIMIAISVRVTWFQVEFTSVDGIVTQMTMKGPGWVDVLERRRSQTHQVWAFMHSVDRVLQIEFVKTLDIW